MCTIQGANSAQSPGEACPNQIRPNVSRALINVNASAALLESIQLGFTKPENVPDHLSIVRDSLRGALTDLGGHVASDPAAGDIEGAVIDAADDYFSPFDTAESVSPVPWSVAKDLIRCGILAGIRLAGGAS